MSHVAPPDTTHWWDTETTWEHVLAILRLQGADVDGERLRALIPAAGALINHHLDRCTPFTEAVDWDGDPGDWDGDPISVGAVPPNVQHALEMTVVAMYRLKDGPFMTGNIATFSAQHLVELIHQISSPIVDQLAVLLPAVDRWGVG